MKDRFKFRIYDKENKKPKNTRKCLYCGKDISNKHINAKFCSNSGDGNCKDAYHNENNPRGYGLEDDYEQYCHPFSSEALGQE